MTERSNLSMMERAHCVINVRTHLETCKPDPPAEPPYMWRVSYRVRPNKKSILYLYKDDLDARLSRWWWRRRRRNEGQPKSARTTRIGYTLKVDLARMGNLMGNAV